MTEFETNVLYGNIRNTLYCKGYSFYIMGRQFSNVILHDKKSLKNEPLKLNNITFISTFYFLGGGFFPSDTYISGDYAWNVISVHLPDFFASD